MPRVTTACPSSSTHNPNSSRHDSLHLKQLTPTLPPLPFLPPTQLQQLQRAVQGVGRLMDVLKMYSVQLQRTVHQVWRWRRASRRS